MHEDVKPYLTKENLQINDVWVGSIDIEIYFFSWTKKSSISFSSEVISSKLILIFFKFMSFTHFGPDLNQREDCRKNRWIWYENDSYSVWMDLLLLLIKRRKEIFFVIFSSCDKILWPKLCVLCNDETCWRYILYIYISSGQDFGQILFSVEQNIKHIKNIHGKIYLLENISTCH